MLHMYIYIYTHSIPLLYLILQTSRSDHKIPTIENPQTQVRLLWALARAIGPRKCQQKSAGMDHPDIWVHVILGDFRMN